MEGEEVARRAVKGADNSWRGDTTWLALKRWRNEWCLRCGANVYRDATSSTLSTEYVT